MKTVEIHRLLEREKQRLNRALVISEILRGAAFTSVGTGALLAMVRCFGLSISWALPIWVLFTVGGATVCFAIGWAHRVDLKDTARWVDRRMKTGEALSAALACLDHGTPGPFDAAIIDRAEGLACKISPVRWPFRYLKRWVGWSLGSLIVGVVLVQTSLYFYSPNRIASLPEMRRPKTVEPSEEPLSEKPNAIKPQDVAKSLAAKDPKLARQMEQALRSGNTALLEHLLQTAELQRAGRSLSEAESSENGTGQKFTGFNLPSNNSTGKNGKVNAENSGQGKKERRHFGTEKGKQRVNKRRQDNGNSPSEMKKNSKKKPSENHPSESKDSDQRQHGKDQGGQEPREQNRYWGDLEANASGRKVVLKQTKDGPMYEYVLPGKQARIPLSRVVQDSRRAAEVSLNRLGVPGEYQEFVQTYFLTLAREAGGASPKKGKE